MADWNAYRQLFPHTAHSVFLNHAAVSPLNKRVLQALQEYQEIRSNSRDNLIYFPEISEKRTRFKELVGRLINAPVSQIARVESTSAGLTLLANGLDWQPGDRILLNDMEFPANVYPFLNQERRGVKVDFVQNDHGRIRLEDLRRAIRPETRLLSISFVQYLNGFRSDLQAVGELCREHDLIFCVDGIQGLGALQVDVQALGVDFWSNGGHKWLMWPMGTGFFYISPRIFERVYPTNAGWLAVENAWDFSKFDLKFLPTAERFEPSGFNVAGMVGAIAELELFLEIGPGQIEAHILETTAYAYERLLENGYGVYTVPEAAHYSGVITFEHEQATALCEFLKSQQIFVSVRSGKIRVSPHFYNTREDIDCLIAAVRKFDSK